MEVLDSNYVYSNLIKRGVTRLCHFTKIKSLVHIVASSLGILATQFIQSDIKNKMIISVSMEHWIMCVVLLNIRTHGIGVN